LYAGNTFESIVHVFYLVVSTAEKRLEGVAHPSSDCADAAAAPANATPRIMGRAMILVISLFHYTGWALRRAWLTYSLTRMPDFESIALVIR
jgi:hypothetical protein